MLQDKIVLLTGAGKGIGEAIAKTLAKEGAHLVLNARTAAHIEAVKKEIAENISSKVRIECIAGDVSDFAFVKSLVEKTIAPFGRIDVLINNAGVCPPFRLLQEATQDDIDKTIDINLKGPVYTMHQVVPHMVHQKGGTIININSIAGKQAYPYSAVYCSTKFGLHALTESISLEQRANGIKVIGIYPGEVKTPLWDVIEPDVKQNPDLMLTDQDVAESVRYVLMQSKNSWVKDVTILPLEAPPH